jgi:hypothetical protein
LRRDAMSVAYRILYGVGFTTWEKMAKSILILEQNAKGSNGGAPRVAGLLEHGDRKARPSPS